MSILITASAFTLSTTGHAIPNPASPTLTPRTLNDSLIPFPFDEAHIGYIDSTFETIASIPPSVLDDGSEAVKQWFLTHEPATTQPALEKRQGWFQVAKCAYEIGLAIVSNALGLSDLKRIKELIEALGGAKAVAKMLLKAKSIRELIVIGGPELVEIVEILSGLDGVIGACFGWV